MVFQKTYELQISFSGDAKEVNEQKQLLLAWLPANGVESFVEGTLDSLDLDPDYYNEHGDYYDQFGGSHCPVSIFDYDLSSLKEIQVKLERDFKGKLKIENFSQETSTWKEGWKESFTPLETNRFYIYPPWEKPDSTTGKIPMEIEPGMAFGTGQHATTQLCLQQIESIASRGGDIANLRFMDIGTGSGILAIAAKKLGFNHVNATDIEAAAVHAAQDNAQVNNVEVNLWKGSVPVPADERDDFHTPYDIVVANILIVVLERIIFDLSEITVSGGLLVLSGLIREQESSMIEMAEEVGFGLVEKHYDGDWVCLELEKLQ
ncbi:MAG: 50S ribosomal protein L11 methyltransferase [Bdellovibrionota bacterium]